MWSSGLKIDRLATQLDNHLKDCIRERQQNASYRKEDLDTSTTRHKENQDGITGLRNVMWCCAGALVLLLLSVIGYLLSNVLTFKHL